MRVVSDHNAYHIGEFAILRQVMEIYAAQGFTDFVLAAGFTTFKVKYAVQDIEDELNRARRQTIAELTSTFDRPCMKSSIVRSRSRAAI